MKVQCERCGATYEFEEALASQTGTPVRCQACEHVFEVKASASPEGRDQWVLRTEEGRELVFSSLGTLQEALLSGAFSGREELRRGEGPWRGLRSIPELSALLAEAAEAAHALRSVAFRSAVDRDTIREKGGIPPLVELLRCGAHTPQAAWAAGALRHLGYADCHGWPALHARAHHSAPTPRVHDRGR